MGIIALVSVMTFTMVNITANEDRIRSSAARIRSVGAGARDRAIYTTTTETPAARGVRFLRDQNNLNTVTSFVYIGAQTFVACESEIRAPSNSPRHKEPLVIDDDNPNAEPGEHRVLFFDEANPSRVSPPQTWFRFRDRGLLAGGLGPNGNTTIQGTPIQIGCQSCEPCRRGQRYTLFYDDNGTPGNFNDDPTHPWRLTRPFQGNVNQDPPAAPPMPNTSRQLDYSYKLRLEPAVLPNAEPVPLAQGIVIDVLPNEDANNNGQLDGGEDLDGDGELDPAHSKIPPQWNRGERMDILFSPQGRVAGSLASFGKLHLLVADVEDVTKGYPPGDPRKEGEERIVSISTRTGSLSVHPVDTTDANNDGRADHPFRFAETGAVSE